MLAERVHVAVLKLCYTSYKHYLIISYIYLFAARNHPLNVRL